MIGRLRALTGQERGARLLRFLGALAARGLEAAGKFGLYMLAARLMGGTDSGLFFLCLTWVNLCSTVARMGLERAMSRHIAAELAIGHGRAARRVLLQGLGWTALASTAIGLATWMFAEPLAVHVFRQPELAGPLAIAAWILPPQSLAFAVGFALIGLNRGVTGQMVQSALPPVLSLAAMAAGLDRLGMVLAVYAGSYAACCALGLGFVARDWVRAMVDRDVEGAAQAEALPGLWASARPFLVVELVQVCLLSAPVMVLGMVAQAAAVSAFSIASRLTMLINTMLISIAMIAAPAFAAHHRRREFAALRRVERQNRLLALAICAPVLAAMTVLAHPLLALMASDSPGAAAVLRVLAIGQAINILLPTQDMMLAMTGHGALLRRLNLQQLVACAVLCAALIPPFGMMGAALVATLGLVQGRVSFALGVRRAIPELKEAG